MVDRRGISGQGFKMYHAIKELLGHRMPRLVVLNVAMVGMMRAVADAPSVVRHKDGRVHDVANEVVQGAVVRKALGRNISGEASLIEEAGYTCLVSAVMSNHKESPEHGTLGEPVERPCPPSKRSVG